MTTRESTRKKSAELERAYDRYFGGSTKPDAVKSGNDSRFEIFTMYKTVPLTYRAETIR